MFVFANTGFPFILVASIFFLLGVFMAKQDFVNGGFVGRLGELIGQRWKNLHTVRTVPNWHDRRSDSQLKCRSIFKRGVDLAHIGQIMNWHAPCFDDESQTEWGLRISRAMEQIRAGASWADSIPVFPKNYSPAFSVSSVSAATFPTATQVSFSASGTLPTVDRVLSGLFVKSDSEIPVSDSVYCRGSYVASSGSLVFDLSQSEFDALGSGVLVVCSVDDSENDGKMLYGSGLVYKS